MGLLRRYKRGFGWTAWEVLLGGFILLIVYQGALRKWFLPGLSTPLYVAKDVALLGAFALYGFREQVRLTGPLRRTLFPVILGGFTFVVCLQAFNFYVPSLAVGLLGIRSYLLYTLLVILVPVALDRIQRPDRVLLVASQLLIVPVLLLGMYQYSQPVGDWINQYVADDSQAVGVLSRPRITGTFSYIGGMGAFLLFSLFFSLGILLAGLRYRHRFYQILGGALLGLSLIVAPMNGSRSVVFGLLLPLPFILYAILTQRRGLAVGLSLLLLSGAGIYVATGSQWATQGWEVIEHRMSKASDQDSRVEDALLDPIEKVSVGGILGYGTGSTHQAAGVLSSSGRVHINGIGYEGEPGRVIIELGIVGAFLYMMLKVWLVWVAWQALRRSSSPWTTMLSVMAFSMIFFHLGTGMIVFNHISSALYWLSAGCAIWVWSHQELRERTHQLAFQEARESA